MAEKNSDIFDKIEEEYKSRCARLDSDNLYLFGNQVSLGPRDDLCSDSTLYEGDVLNIDVVDEILPEVAPEVAVDVIDEEEMEINEYLTKDPVARQQFEYNRSTCFVNDHPEIGINMSVSVAPAEGKVPKNILLDPYWDKWAFSRTDPDANNSLKSKRETVRDQEVFSQRMLNVNKTVTKSPAYLFAAVQYIETKQLQGNLNIAFKKGKRTVSDEGVSYKLDDPYRVLDNIKGTPRYFQTKKMEFVSKLENLGPFTIFFTLSCADRKWSENFTSLLKLQGHDVQYSHQFDEVKIDGITLVEFMNQNEGQHEFIRKNILNATRIFDERLKSFIKNIIMSKFSQLPISYYNYRIEWQARGAAHCHGALWVDFKQFSKQNPGFENLEAAIENMTNDKVLSEDEEDLITSFADMTSSVSLKDPATADIVGEVNRHHCTRACRKYSTHCRFHFPKFPVGNTLVATPAKVTYSDPEVRTAVSERAKFALSKVKNVLRDKAVMTQILKETESQDIKSRIIALLLRAEFHDVVDISPADTDELYCRYVECLKISFGGYQILLRRDIDEIYINNYRREWIRAWNANLDIQICLDHYAVVTYIMEYMNKDESGTFEFIQKALKDSENESLREKLKLVKNTFQTHRQIGECEALYRLLSSFHMSESNIGTFFAHTGFRHNKSKMLREISKEEAKERGSAAIILADYPDKYF